MRVLTSDLLKHVMGRLMSYLSRQEATISRPSLSDSTSRDVPARGVTVKISPKRELEMIPCGFWHPIYRNMSQDVG